MSPTRVLVVEDERIVALHMKQQLSKLGYDVVAISASGESALEKITALRPDAVLMDIHIEGKLDGIEAAARIPSELGIAVIYVTAYSEESTLERARTTKPFGYLVKPFSERELHASIQIAIERRRWESELQASQEQISRERDAAQRYLDVAGVMIAVLNVDTTVKLINRRGCEILGYDEPKDIVGKPWIDHFIPERMRETMREVFGRLISEVRAGVEYYENPVLTMTGEERTIAWRNTILTNDQGRATALLSSGEDITERKQVEDELRLSEARFRELAENIQEVFWLSSTAKDKILYVSPAFEAIWGRSCKALYESPLLWVEAIHPEDRPRILEAATKRQATSEYNEEYRIVRPNGVIRWIADRAFPIRDESGNVYRIAGVAQDITERKQAEARFAQSQKMEAVGLLTGGIAHDFNNLLAIMQGNLELIQEGSASESETAKMIDDALRAAMRGASLTHQLLAFARRQPLSPKVVSLNQLVSDLTGFLRRTLGETVAIRTSMPSDLWMTRIDPHHLENALMNLALNARHAMPNGGILSITGTNKMLDESFAEQNTEVAPGPYVVLSVTDTGTGMTRDVLDSALEPFFTTKPVGQGSGLGLSMVYGFAKQSGGHLKIYSEPGQGTTVHLYLPKATGDAVQPAPASDAAFNAQARPGEVILVLEDDEMVRKLAVRLLSSLGYRTIDAADGSDALRVLSGPDRVDLLLTDVVLPKGMSGAAVVEQAKMSRPGLKVLYMSGYAKDAILGEGTREMSVHLLTKPFSKAELARNVREILDERGRA